MVLLAWLGVLGLDGLVQLVLGVPTPLSLLSMLGGIIVVVLCLVTPKVPARVVGPGILFVGWVTLGAMPLLLWLLETGFLNRVIALLQLLLAGGLAAVVVRRNWQERPAFDVRRTLALLALG